MRGSAVAISRSKIHTSRPAQRDRQPMGWPSRSLKFAMLWADLLITPCDR